MRSDNDSWVERMQVSPLGEGARPWIPWLLLLSLGGCSDSVGDGGSTGGTGGRPASSGAGSGGVLVSPVGGQSGMTTGSGAAPGASGGAPGTSGAPIVNGSGGVAQSPGSGGASGGAAGLGAAGLGAAGLGAAASAGAGSGGSGNVGGKSSGGATSAAEDHCLYGYSPDPGDATMKDGPVEFVKSNQVDLIVQPEVLAFMNARKWQEAHFEWHSIRRCMGGFSGERSTIDICSFTEMIPADQECKSDGDGYQFFVVHRHMIQALRQRFPSHAEQFAGFPHFPKSAEDLPPQWRESWVPFNATTAENGRIADEIDKPENLSRFESEGAFGRWIQCFAPQSSGLHGDLHFKWVRSLNTEHGLGNQVRNLDNYLFWKMHGWIDDVWEKYRRAKGLTPDEPKLKEALVAQCREMDALSKLVGGTTEPDPVEPTLPESGVFHEMVRPILENDTNKCTGCHGPQGPEAGLTLGGVGVSSAKVVAALVNQPAIHGGQFKLVVPGQPDQSWLYLKVAGLAGSAGCTPSATADCTTQVMPPNGGGQVTLKSNELETLRQWITDGAQPPTSP